jgi:AsmA protein
MQARRRRLSSVTLAMLVWLGLGLAAPVLFSLYSSDLGLQSATVVAAPRDSFTLDRPIELSQSPQVTVERGTIVLVNTSGKESTGEPIETMLARGDAGLVLDGATILVSPNRWTVASAEGQLAPLVGVVKNINWESLAIRRGTFIIALPGGQVESLNDVEADVSLKRKGTVAVKGSALLRGQRVSFQATSGTQVERKGPPHLPLKLQLKSPLLEFTFDGRLGLGEDVQLQGQGEVQIERARQAARWFGAAWPSGGPGLRKLSAKGQFDWTKHTLEFDKATFRMDGNEATGVLGLNLRGARPTITGTLALRSLDLSQYLAGSEQDGGEPLLSWTSLAASLLEAPFGTMLSADVRISAERVMAGNVELGRSAASITLKDGRLLADLAELQLIGGKGGGQIRADFTGYHPKLALRVKLDDVDLGRVSTVLAGHGILQGPATVVADITASGVTGSDLARTLGGRLNIRAQQGGRLGIDIKSLQAAAQAGESEGWGAGLRGTTPFDRLDLRLVVRDGVVLSETAELIAGDTSWSATGSVSLPASRLDLRVVQGTAVTPARPTGEQAKARTLELRGPWSVPQVKAVPDASNATAPGEWPAYPVLHVPADQPDRG